MNNVNIVNNRNNLFGVRRSAFGVSSANIDSVKLGLRTVSRASGYALVFRAINAERPTPNAEHFFYAEGAS